MVVPTIYSRIRQAPRLSQIERWIAFLVASSQIALLIVSAGLTPSAGGVGTHLSLGLSPCGFLAKSGIPCLSCGMTTSFAHFAEANVLASLYVQPMGALLAFIAAGIAWVGLYIAWTGRPIHRLMRLLPMRSLLLGGLFFAFAAWGWKILIHLSGWDGWTT